MRPLKPENLPSNCCPATANATQFTPGLETWTLRELNRDTLARAFKTVYLT